MWDENDPADWWKDDNESNTTHKPTPKALTETEAKIAHYEDRSKHHWWAWKEFGSKTNLYWWKQTNIKIFKLKGLIAKGR